MSPEQRKAKLLEVHACAPTQTFLDALALAAAATASRRQQSLADRQTVAGFDLDLMVQSSR